MPRAILLSHPDTFHYFFHGFHVAGTIDLGFPSTDTTSPVSCLIGHQKEIPLKSPPFWVSSFSLSDGTPQLQLFRHGEEVALRVARAGTFLIGRSGIQVANNGDMSPVPYLLGRVFALWLELFHMPVLHGATLLINGGAHGFLGHSGAGKSTLTGYLNTKGYPLITDDLIPLEAADSGCRIQPGIPISRMWPEFGRRFYGEAFETFAKVHPEIEKRRVPAMFQGRQRFTNTAAPLQTLFLLERDPACTQAQAVRLSPAQALVQLAGASSIYLEINALGLQTNRLKTLAQVVEHTDVFKLRYGNGIKALAQARKQIATCLRGQTTGASV